MPAAEARAMIVGLTLALVTPGCGGSAPPSTDPPDDGPFHIVASQDSVAVHPSQSAVVSYRLLDDKGEPTADRIILFSIVDDPNTTVDEARGSTLSFDRGVTDAAGLATVQVIAGPQPTVFKVRAHVDRASDAEVLVFVNMATYAPVELLPVLVDTPPPGTEITTVRLHLLDETSCAAVHFQDIPRTPLQPRTLPTDMPAFYPTVNTEVDHAAVAIGLDATGAIRAVGCVDLPGALLVVEAAVRVVVPLKLLRLGPTGRYTATSSLGFRAPPPGATLVAEAWGDLALCPMDPARLWLDCTIDALRTTESDPSDCHPADDEGPLGQKLNLRRGVPLPVPASGHCRDRMDGAGRMSHEVLVDGLFPAPRPPLLTGLGALGMEARLLLDSLKLSSVLSIEATSTPDRYQIEHRLVKIEFPLATRPAVVDLGRMGAPVVSARFVPGTARGNDLAIGAHGFTLRLGSAAFMAFADVSLKPRGGGGDVDAFSNALFGLATRDDRGTPLTGCAALDALLCGDVGEARGCLVAACTEGLAALGRRLEGAFTALDGDGLDLVLGGSVPMLDRDGNGRVDTLGMVNQASSSTPGLWSGEVRGRGGPSTFTGIWTAEIVP